MSETQPQPAPEMSVQREVVGWQEESYYTQLGTTDVPISFPLEDKSPETIANESDPNDLGFETYREVTAKIKDGDRMVDMTSGRLGVRRYILDGQALPLATARRLGKDTQILERWSKQGITRVFVARNGDYYADDGKTESISPPESIIELTDME